MHFVELDVTPGAEEQLASDYRERFAPAISAQPGFRAVRLFRPRAGSRWLLLIEFDSEEERLAWVATPVHQAVWPALARSCTSASGTDFEEELR
jgi:heme-degrading monooxygenase HmoA